MKTEKIKNHLRLNLINYTMFLIGLIFILILIVPELIVADIYIIKSVLFYSIGMVIISLTDIGISLPDPIKTELDIEKIYDSRKKVEHNELKIIKYSGYMMCIISILLIILFIILC